MNEVRNERGVFIKGHTTSQEIRDKISKTLDTVGDLTGQTFGLWFVIERRGIVCTHRRWLCRCVCGVEKLVSQVHLIKGTTTKCQKCVGRLKSERVTQERLSDSSRLPYTPNRRSIWAQRVREKLFEVQKGVCPICNRNLPEDSAEQCVDHDHLTGYCRALVHRSCNVWIGRVENDPELPKRTMDYLERFKTN